MAKTKQDHKGKEILEDPSAILDKFRDSEAFFEKNKKVILYALGAVAAVVVGFLFYKYQQSQNNDNGQVALINPVFAWEKDSLKKALGGDEGLDAIAADYSGTDAGNLANFYAGVAFLKQGKYDDAIAKLQEFKSKDLLLQGIAYSLTGDAYLEKKEYEGAMEYYQKAIEYKPNETFTPKYLMKLALVQELNKDFGSAAASYGKIIDEYPLSAVVNDAKKYKARAEGLAQGK